MLDVRVIWPYVSLNIHPSIYLSIYLFIYLYLYIYILTYTPHIYIIFIYSRKEYQIEHQIPVFIRCNLMYGHLEFRFSKLVLEGIHILLQIKVWVVVYLLN